MSVTTNVNERLAALTAAGTSVWLDQIRRSLITGGELQRLVDEDALRTLLGAAAPPHYVAIMAYVNPTPAFDAAVERLRASIRDRTKATTTFGYGPRFLHSTGQLHKGGPPTGRFLHIVHDGPEDVEIPGEGYTFSTLKKAQAVGDLQTLRDHGLPAERVRLQGDPAKALDGLRERIERLGD